MSLQLDPWLQHNCVHLDVKFNSDMKNVTFRDCRKSKQEANHQCVLQQHGPKTKVYIQDIDCWYFYEAPSYICGKETSIIRNILLHRDSFITPNVTDIETYPQIVKIGQNTLVSRYLCEQFCDVINDMSTTTNTIYNKMFYLHLNKCKLHKHKIGLMNFNIEQLKDKLRKHLISKYKLRLLEYTVQLRHIYVLKQQIHEYILSLYLRKLNIDYTYRHNKNIYDRYYYKTSHDIDDTKNDDEISEQESNDNDSNDNEIISLCNDIKNLTINPVVHFEIGTETILDQRNLILHYGLAPGCSEGHHILVMSVMKLLSQYFEVWRKLKRNIAIPNQIGLCTDGLRSNIAIPNKTIAALKKYTAIPHAFIDQLELYVTFCFC